MSAFEAQDSWEQIITSKGHMTHWVNKSRYWGHALPMFHQITIDRTSGLATREYITGSWWNEDRTEALREWLTSTTTALRRFHRPNGVYDWTASVRALKRIVREKGKTAIREVTEEDFSDADKEQGSQLQLIADNVKDKYGMDATILPDAFTSDMTRPSRDYILLDLANHGLVGSPPNAIMPVQIEDYLESIN